MSRSAKNLKEAVETLREYMQSASAYPGPEPGVGRQLDTGFAGQPHSSSFRNLGDDHLTDQEKADKRKKKDFRAALRHLSQWLQRKHTT